MYFWGDGIHVQAGREDAAQRLLVIIGATPEGKKKLVSLIDGVPESAQPYKKLLLDLKLRGLAMPPEFAVADGALGFWQAIEKVWPATRGQRAAACHLDSAIVRPDWAVRKPSSVNDLPPHIVLWCGSLRNQG